MKEIIIFSGMGLVALFSFAYDAYNSRRKFKTVKTIYKSRKVGITMVLLIGFLFLGLLID